MRNAVTVTVLILVSSAASAQTAQGVGAGCRHQLSADAGNPLPAGEAQSQAEYCLAAIRHVAKNLCPQLQIDEKAAVRDVVAYMVAHPERGPDPAADTVLRDVLALQGCGKR